MTLLCSSRMINQNVKVITWTLACCLLKSALNPSPSRVRTGITLAHGCGCPRTFWVLAVQVPAREGKRTKQRQEPSRGLIRSRFMESVKKKLSYRSRRRRKFVGGNLALEKSKEAHRTVRLCHRIYW